MGNPNRAKVPKEASILVEVGTRRPIEVAYDPLGPFRMLWVVTNGKVRRNFLWLTVRKTCIYVAFGGPGGAHTSYHADGRFHWKVQGDPVHLDQKPSLPNLHEPVLIQSATTVISDEALRRFDLTRFVDRPVDRIVYLDNRVLPDAICYHVWVVPPFHHGAVPLLTVHPAHIHVVTHTNPWMQVVIYEQGRRVPARWPSGGRSGRSSTRVRSRVRQSLTRSPVRLTQR